MFTQLANWYAGQAGGQRENVFLLRPAQLVTFLDEAWRQRVGNLQPPLGIPSPEQFFFGAGGPEWHIPADNLPRANQAAVWDHLIFAYLVENTLAFEIFARVVERYAQGELLDIPPPPVQVWLRSTEQLFLRDGPSGSVASLTSWVRPDMRANRRNLYYRMFGVDCNHGKLDGSPYPYEKAEAANRQFVPVFEDLLREVWRGVENSTNTAGANATDDSAIANLCRQLSDMLNARRRSGHLDLAELVHVATMDWFYLTVAFDSPLVVALSAQAPSAAERLLKIGRRVGLAPHSRTHDYLMLAPAMSTLLRVIESGVLNTPAAVPALYLPQNAPNPLRDTALTVITHWSSATGRDMKTSGVTVSTRPAAAGLTPVAPLPAASVQAPVSVPVQRPASNGTSSEVPWSARGGW